MGTSAAPFDPLTASAALHYGLTAKVLALKALLLREYLKVPAAPVAPRSSYGAPAAPQPTYNAPQPTYSAPKPTYSAPKPVAPKPTYSAPKPVAPKPTYSAPKPAYKAPSSHSHHH